jgi:ketosteroid isomerase-like protein
MDVKDIANQFVSAINKHDIDVCYELMSEDFRFIDSEGRIFEGRKKSFWLDYFGIVPDYKISISEVLVSGNTVVLLGTASGTYTPDGTLNPDNYWNTTAAWRAVIIGDRIKECQVYADNEPIRAIMRRYSRSGTPGA